MTSSRRLVVITGMSGAGRSLAAKAMEDLGFFVVDNLPVDMISDVVTRVLPSGPGIGRMAVVADIRGGLQFSELRTVLQSVAAEGVAITLLYLDADDEELSRRFEETRRPHPVPGETLAESLEAERQVMEDVRGQADVIIDTTDLTVHDLRHSIRDIFSSEVQRRPLQVTVTSFGFKHGVPRVVDLLLDVRFLPNPHWVDELRPLTGLDQAVRGHVLDDDNAVRFLSMTRDLLDFLIPLYTAEGKSYLTIALGCTGGKHRSVVLAEELGLWLSERGDVEPAVRHRDVEK